MQGVVFDETTPFLVFTVQTQSNDLTYPQPYKVRQQVMHRLIEYMHDEEGMGYRTIAKKLNSWGIKTVIRCCNTSYFLAPMRSQERCFENALRGKH